MTPKVNDTNQGDKVRSQGAEKAPRPPQSVFSTMLAVGVFSGLLVLIIWIMTQRVSDPLLTILGIFGFVGVYPLTYLAYWGMRVDAKRKRLKDDLQLLGLVERDENLDDTVEILFNTVYSPIQFVTYIALVVLVSFLIIISYLYRNDLGFIRPEIMSLVFFGYLGAYVFSVQQIIRRYNTFDLQPQVYASTLVRILVATAVNYVGSSVVILAGGQIATGSQTGTQIEPQSWAAVIAFVIGVFPSQGIRWLMQQSGRVVNSAESHTNERPLTRLLGISTWHEARFSEVGIDDAQNLANSDIRKLLSSTQFDTHELIHWIDQAILYVKVGDRLERFRDIGISTSRELRSFLSHITSTDIRGAGGDLSQSGPVDSLKTLSILLGLSGLEDFERLSDFSSFPNYVHVEVYYSGAEKVAHQRAGSGLLYLSKAVEKHIDYERVLDFLVDIDEVDLTTMLNDGKRVLAESPNDPGILLSIGTIYYRLGRMAEALQVYDQAIKINASLAAAYSNRSLLYIEVGHYDDAIQDCTRAIRIDPSQSRAFNNRGLAYFHKGYPDLAVKDFNAALRLDERLAVAYYNRGVIENASADFEAAARDFERAYLLGYIRVDLSMGWGEALINLHNYDDAINKLSKAILLGKPDLVARAYAYRGYAYSYLGPASSRQSRLDYETAAKRAGEIIARDDTNVMARFTLAITYFRLNKIDDARDQFEILAQAAPAESYESREALAWLARDKASRLFENVYKRVEQLPPDIKSDVREAVDSIKIEAIKEISEGTAPDERRVTAAAKSLAVDAPDVLEITDEALSPSSNAVPRPTSTMIQSSPAIGVSLIVHKVLEKVRAALDGA